MMPLSRLLDRLLGPRGWIVIAACGTHFATATTRRCKGDVIIRSNMRAGAAFNLARRLRQKAEDTPRRVL